MQTSTGRHAQAPGATLTHAQAVQLSQSVRNTHSPLKKRAETEMASVLEEVTAHYAAMVGVAAIETVTFVVSEAVTFAVPVTVFAFVAVVQLAVIALREAGTICAVVFVRVHNRRAVVSVSGRAVISHTSSARAALGTKARTWSTATAEASTTATTSRRSSKASTTAAAVASTTTTAVIARRVSAAREDER
jgi:hypothetical protein